MDTRGFPPNLDDHPAGRRGHCPARVTSAEIGCAAETGSPVEHAARQPESAQETDIPMADPKQEGPSQEDPAQVATEWLRSVYGGLVVLAAPEPVAETPRARLFGCEPDGSPGTPMLNAAVVVPKNGTHPFHPSTSDPWADVAQVPQDPRERDFPVQAWRINARGCVVAADASISGAEASAGPWHPAHEAPGWWDRLLRQHFPTARVSTCSDWDAVVGAVRDAGPDARGVVWVRRQARGVEITGHLLFVHNNDGEVVVLDPQAGTLATPESEGVRELVLARIPAAESTTPGSQRPAATFQAAVRKAEAWLGEVHGSGVSLVDPDEEDEMSRCWLFACNTAEFRETGDWDEGMLDAALVVPKDAERPFGLPNSEPWEWLRRWDSEGEDQDLPPAPAPGPAAWLEPTLDQLGSLLSSSQHTSWEPLLSELATLPRKARALVWVRRADRRGRESVGLLINAANTEDGVLLIDSTRDEPATLESDVLALHLIRYR